MANKNRKFENNKIYHITVRAIDDNLLFKDINDYYRGIFSIYEFNNTKPTTIRKRRKDRLKEKKQLKIDRDNISAIISAANEMDCFVDILAFCLMPNHIHLLVRQLKDNGTTDFMRKSLIGFAGYFNKKYKRKGHLFQETFNSAEIKTDKQLLTVFGYIHSNPISTIYPKWKETGIRSIKKAINCIEKYKWSSYGDYVGNHNFPSITNRTIFEEIFNGKENIKNFMECYVAGKVQK